MELTHRNGATTSAELKIKTHHKRFFVIGLLTMKQTVITNTFRIGTIELPDKKCILTLSIICNYCTAKFGGIRCAQTLALTQTCAATVKVFRYASNTYVVADVGCKFSEVINTASSNNVNLIPGVGATLTIGVGCIMFIIVDHMSNGASHISPEDSERGRAPFNTRERSGG